jgi:hypothetical protein
MFRCETSKLWEVQQGLFYKRNFIQESDILFTQLLPSVSLLHKAWFCKCAFIPLSLFYKELLLYDTAINNIITTIIYIKMFFTTTYQCNMYMFCLKIVIFWFSISYNILCLFVCVRHTFLANVYLSSFIYKNLYRCYKVKSRSNEWVVKNIKFKYTVNSGLLLLLYHLQSSLFLYEFPLVISVWTLSQVHF